MSVASPAGIVAADHSDTRTMAVVGSAHFISHVLQLALTPLLPLLNRELNASFVELGLVLAVFYATSGLGQIVAGVLVDRFGSHRLLISGVVLQSSAVGAMAFVPHYGWLLPLAVLAGLGNSVYHPADLSILSQRVSTARLGRAFASHVLAGVVGFGLSPVLVGAMAAFWGWRPALLATGGLGLAIAGVLAVNRQVLVIEGSHQRRRGGDGDGARLGFLHIIATPVVLLAFSYFALTAFAINGVQSFAISALTQGYGAVLALATFAVAAYQLGSAGGVITGGLIADRTSRHHLVAMSGLASAAALTLVIAETTLPLVAIIGLVAAAGFATGITMPSRDVLVRRSAPQDGLGKVFGIVYSGFDVGSLVGPLVYGALLDRRAASMVFLVSATGLLLAMVTVIGVKARPAAGTDEVGHAAHA